MPSHLWCSTRVSSWAPHFHSLPTPLSSLIKVSSVYFIRWWHPIIQLSKQLLRLHRSSPACSQTNLLLDDLKYSMSEPLQNCIYTYMPLRSTQRNSRPGYLPQPWLCIEPHIHSKLLFPQFLTKTLVSQITSLSFPALHAYSQNPPYAWSQNCIYQS